MLLRASRSTTYLAFVFLVACWTQVPSAARAADTDPYVTFNTHSRIFHHPECDSALACTRNCVRIRRSDALSRGGRPCKHCGGGLRLRISDAEWKLRPGRYGYPATLKSAADANSHQH
jgi:hypothetical protein